MFKKILIAGVAALCFNAYGAPMTFSGAVYSTAATAQADGMNNANAATNPPTAMPLISTATAAGLNDFATAAGTASAGLLTAASTADSLAGSALAEGRSSFAATVDGSGRLHFFLDFGTFGSLAGGSGSASLSVLLTNTVGTTTTTLHDQVYGLAGMHVLHYDTPMDSISQLQLLVISQAATTGADQLAQTFGQVEFSGTVTDVPEPATLAFFALGLGMLGALKRRWP